MKKVVSIELPSVYLTGGSSIIILHIISILIASWLTSKRNFINRMITQEIKRSKRSLQPVSILMTDIDHFKKINDTYGHQVIIKIAKLLTEVCRETDYVGRYGGEEFLVVLTNTNEDGGLKTYENETAEEMIKLADRALYQAKEKGRICIVSA